MLDFGEVLDKTRILHTEELVISEGFRRELMRTLDTVWNDVKEMRKIMERKEERARQRNIS